jgi:hypothetical protein
MLFDNPLYVIKGITVYPDDDENNKEQFYYLPLIPRVSSEVQNLSGTKIVVPRLQLIMYTGAAGAGGAGGFLNFDVDLGISEERLDEVRKEIKRRQQLSALPRLAPVPWVDGTVTMTMFGETAGGASSSTAGGVGSGSQFVSKISYPAKPALYGDNRATFSASLKQDGAALMHRLMDPDAGGPGAISPVSITYALNFWALRPAYHAKIEADWEQVQSRLADKFQYNSLIFSADIDRSVDEMLNSQDSTKLLKVDTYVTETEDNKAISERRDAAVEELKEMITATFFEPAANPRVEQPPDMQDRVYDKIKRGGAMIATLGATEVVGAFTFKKINFKAVDTRSLNGDISERTTVVRRVSPQGHLAWALNDLRRQGADLKSLIKFADLDDPFFRKRTIKVDSGVDFSKDSIRAIDVMLKYGKEQESISLTSTAESKEKTWSSATKDGAMLRDVAVSYTVSFKDADGMARPRSLTSTPRVTESEHLTLDPREMYSFLDVPIAAASDFPWERFPNVMVETRYVDDDHGIRNERTHTLNKDAKSQTWTIFQRDPLLRKFQYRVTFQAPSKSQNRVTAWQENDASRIDIDDPLPGKVDKRVRVSGFDWAKTELVIVEVKYEDTASGVRKQQSLEFNQEKSGLKTFTYNPPDVPDREMIKYQATIVSKDDESEIPWSDTNEKVLTIKPGAKGHRIIQVRLEPKLFDTKKLMKVTVKMEYTDPAHNLTASDKFVFQSPGDQYIFEFDYAAEKKNRYRYSVDYLDTDGFTTSKDWVETAEAKLVVPV